jgi:hypothetical protein
MLAASIYRGPACGMMPSAALKCLRQAIGLSLNLPKIRQRNNHRGVVTDGISESWREFKIESH